MQSRYVFVRTCAYRRKPKRNFCEIALGFKAACIKSFYLIWDIIFICMVPNSQCRRLYGFTNLSAYTLIIYAASKRISLSADSDQMAPPSGLPPPLKRWTKLFALCLFVLTFFICFSYLVFILYLLFYSPVHRLYAVCFQKSIALGKMPASKKSVVCWQWRRVSRFKHKMIGICDELLLWTCICSP